MTATATLSRRRLQPSDLTRLSTVGLRTRKLRAGLSALGIAIGVAAIVAVLGLSASSQQDLDNLTTLLAEHSFPGLGNANQRCSRNPQAPITANPGGTNCEASPGRPALRSPSR